jgi:hypothetical protein
MPKTLKDFLEVYKPKSPDEQKFVDKHVVIKHKDRNGNGDDVFNGNTKTIKRKEERHGYDVGEDEKVYEEMDLEDLLGEAIDLLNSIDEKTLTPAEMKKREEVVKAIKRENPKMDKSMAYAVATKTAKRVAEEAEELDESAKIAAHLIKRYGDNVRKSHVRSAADDFGVGYVALSHAVRKKLGVTRLQEEEQIDELSSDTVKSYMGKAIGDAVQKTQAQQKKKYASDIKADQKGIDKRVRGLTMAKKKMAAEEVEVIDELSKDTLSNYADKASDARGHRNLSTKKVDNRYAGVKKASDKLTKEEVEAIDELSKSTMGRYINRAKDVIDSASYRQGHRDSRGDGGSNSVAKGIERKLSKRHKGIETAVKKLTKEDVINRAVEKYVPEEIKFTPEERLLKRIDGLSEAHVLTLLGLFEALNKDNQNKMIETVETREGINQLLNFVLENRGK